MPSTKLQLAVLTFTQSLAICFLWRLTWHRGIQALQILKCISQNVELTIFLFFKQSRSLSSSQGPEKKWYKHDRAKKLGESKSKVNNVLLSFICSQDGVPMLRHSFGMVEGFEWSGKGEHDSICMGLRRRASPLSNPTSAAIAPTSSPETSRTTRTKAVVLFTLNWDRLMATFGWRYAG